MKVHIFKRNTATLEYVAKSEVTEVTNINFKKSASNLRQTTLKILIDEQYSIDDITINYPVLFEVYELGMILGIIKNVNYDLMASERSIEITVALGSDGLTEEVQAKYSDNAFSNIISNYQNLHQTDIDDVIELIPPVDDTNYLVAPDGVLEYGQAVRQLLKQGYRENLQIVNEKIQISYERDSKEYELRSEDVSKCSVTIAKDTYNKYIIFNEENLTQTLASYLDINGNVIHTPTNIISEFAIITGSKTVSLEDFTQTYCDNALKQQAYSNSIELELVRGNYVFDYIFENYIFSSLGTVIKFNYKNTVLNTYIDEINITGKKIGLKLGVSQTRLIDKLGGK